MAKEYIEREAFKAEIRRLSTHYLNEWDTLGVLAAADRIPAADVRPAVRGEWRERRFSEDVYGAECSVCHTTWDAPTNFCPNCGAMMEES